MEVKGCIRDYIATNLLFTPGEFPYADDASFLNHGIIDSLGVMELVSFAAKKFAISVAPSEVTPANFDSVDNLSSYISRKLLANAAAEHARTTSPLPVVGA